MTDAAMAQEIVQEAFPVHLGRNITAAIGAAYEALTRHERGLPRAVIAARPRQWTERRVKAIWHREARRIDHYEIQDLTAVAVMEATNERQRLKAREERLAAFIAAHGSGSREPVDQPSRRGAGRLDNP